MVKKKLSVGLILLLLLLALGGCQDGGVAKDVVFSQEQKSADEIKNVMHANVSVQQTEAIAKATAAFQHYFNIQNIDKNLSLKAVLIEDDGDMWMNPYWKLSWLGKDAKKPVYTAKIDAQSGEVVQLRYRPDWSCKNVSKEDWLKNQKAALAFIDKFALVKETPLSLFEAYSSKMEGIAVEFRYGIDKFIAVNFNETGNVAGFEFSQQVAYTRQGTDLKVDRAEAIKIAQASIKQYFGEVDTSGLIEQVRLFEGNQGEKRWFVSWKNIFAFDSWIIQYGADIDALSGKLYAVNGTNRSAYNEPIPTLENNEEKMREIADRFLHKKQLSNYRFEAYDKDTGTLLYRDKTGSPLHVYVDRSAGEVSSLFFFEY